MDIRSDNYYYVDKTEFVYKLVNTGKYYFLSRPRRFGKSLLLDTIRQAFLGKKELFEGLFLEKNWDWSVSYPVIHISFGLTNIRTETQLEKFIWSLFTEISKSENLKIGEELIERAFYVLIKEIYLKYGQKVVVLVDEYDKPLLDTISDIKVAEKIRNILKNLYTVLKDTDPYLKFVMLTGVSKFSKVSIFSGLNQLNDITLDRQFSTICGYTEKELVEVFKEELKDENIDKIREWYNGYSFCGEKVYNPFDVLLYLAKREFHPYWFETGTPNFLVKLLMDRRFPVSKLERITATDDLLGSFDIDFVEPETLLFQTGYITVLKCETSFDGALYYLTYPNKEVKISLNRYVARIFTQNNRITDYLLEVREIFKTGNIQALETVLRSLFAGIPNDWYRKNRLSEYEGYYASVVYSFLVSTGLNIIPEDTTSSGRIDLTVICEDKVYIMEFKVLDAGNRGKSALKQIEEKEYHQKYAGKYKIIYLVGMEFNRNRRNIESFEYTTFSV